MLRAFHQLDRFWTSAQNRYRSWTKLVPALSCDWLPGWLVPEPVTGAVYHGSANSSHSDLCFLYQKNHQCINHLVKFLDKFQDMSDIVKYMISLVSMKGSLSVMILLACSSCLCKWHWTVFSWFSLETVTNITLSLSVSCVIIAK